MHVLAVYRYGTKTLWETRGFVISLLLLSPPALFFSKISLAVPCLHFPHSFALESNKLGIKFCNHLLGGYVLEVLLANSLDLIGKVGSKYFKMIIKNEMRWCMQRV